MPIRLDLFLAADRYDAASGQNPREAEWPPNPARIHSALRSVATEDELGALRELESLEPPTVHAVSTVTQGRSRTYVVTNKREPKGGHLTHPGRTSGLRERRSVYPTSPRVQLIWRDDGAVDDGTVATLDALARRVPYLGRSTSPVLMGVQRVDDVRVPAGLSVFQPSIDDSLDVHLRVAYKGYTEELDSLHASDLPAWQASDGRRARRGYRLVDPDAHTTSTQSPALHSPYKDLVVLRFLDARPAGRLTANFTRALRSMVMGATGDPLPPALHGHGYDGNPHVAYLGLPVCGHPHADGHLVGLAVAIPGMDGIERSRILRGILGHDGDGSVTLTVPGIREPFSMIYQASTPLPKSATVQHWTGASRQWVTVTPIVLDRYPKNGDRAAAVAQTIALAGLPEPTTVTISDEAMTEGGIRLQPGELPRRARGRLFCHARITFDRPVSGPLIAGAGRYFGVGLLLPERFEGGENHAG